MSVALALLAAVAPQGAGDLDGLSLDALEERFRAGRRVLTEKVLRWENGTVTMVARGSELGELLDVPGHGAYVDFGAERHQYDDGIDLMLENRHLGVAGWGGDVGWILDLGDIALARLPDAADPPPAALSPDLAEAWSRCWMPLTGKEAVDQVKPAIAARDLPAAVGHTYLLRLRSNTFHDRLTAVWLIALEDDRCELAYRVLAEWRVEHPRPRSWRSPPTSAELPDQGLVAQFREMSEGELRAHLVAVRETARARLEELPEEPCRHYRELVGDLGASSGIAHIVASGTRWSEVVPSRNFRFVERERGWNGAADIDLQRGGASGSVHTGKPGWIVDLGAIRFDDLASVMRGSPPADLDPAGREAWDLVFEAEVERDERGRPRRSPELDQNLGFLHVDESAPAQLGHGYLLRSLCERWDRIVVFTVIALDEDGATIAWNVLRNAAR